jgi:hypothetical protein
LGATLAHEEDQMDDSFPRRQPLTLPPKLNLLDIAERHLVATVRSFEHNQSAVAIEGDTVLDPDPVSQHKQPARQQQNAEYGSKDAEREGHSRGRNQAAGQCGRCRAAHEQNRRAYQDPYS